MKLKFSSDNKQIIKKEWTQTLFLEGKKQIPSLSYTDKNNKEIEKVATEPFISDPSNSLNNPFPFKVSIPDNLGLSDKFETRIEAIALSWDSGAHNRTFSPTLTAPNQASGVQSSKDFSLSRNHNYTIASQLFYRLKGKQNWSASPPFTNYYAYSSIKLKVNQLLFKKGEKLNLTFTIPEGYTNDKINAVGFSIFNRRNFLTINQIDPTGNNRINPNADQKAFTERYLSFSDYESAGTNLNQNKDYTISFNTTEDVEETFLFKILIDGKSGSIADIETRFSIRLETTE